MGERDDRISARAQSNIQPAIGFVKETRVATPVGETVTRCLHPQIIEKPASVIGGGWMSIRYCRDCGQTTEDMIRIELRQEVDPAILGGYDIEPPDFI